MAAESAAPLRSVLLKCELHNVQFSQSDPESVDGTGACFAG